MVEEIICPFNCYITHSCHPAAHANRRLFKAILQVLLCVDSQRPLGMAVSGGVQGTASSDNVA